jgi:Transposase IS116/IS110/IS902 family.
MNLLLHNVVSDITGLTGMKIIKAILAGERDPKVLARNRDERCKNSSTTIAKSLVGNYRAEHLFALRQAVDLYEIYQAKIADCDQAIMEQVNQQPDVSDEGPPPAEKRVQARDRIRDGVDVRHLLFKKSGVDLFAIPGLAADTLLTLASEVGFDMAPWKTEKHFASWLGLCPGTKISGGKVLHNKTKRMPNRAAQAFRMAAASLYRSQTALGAFHRRIKHALGEKKPLPPRPTKSRASIMRCSPKELPMSNWANKLTNNVSKSDASFILSAKLNPLAFN